MKTIDANKLIEEIQKIEDEYILGGDYSDGVIDTCEEIIKIIKSLSKNI